MSQSFDDSNTIKQIKEAFPQLSNDEKIKAFSQLVRMKENEGAFAIMDLLRQYAHTGILPDDILSILSSTRERPEVYFPDLLNYISLPQFTYHIVHLCVFYLHSNPDLSIKLESHLDVMLSTYRTFRSANHHDQRLRFATGYLIGILAYFQKPEVEAELYASLDSHDETSLKFKVIRALWTLNRPVDEKYIIELITYDWQRINMFEWLKRRGELALFPEQYRTAEAFARAKLVLSSEITKSIVSIGIPKMEFVEVIQIDSEYSQDNGDYYIYRVLTEGENTDTGIWVTGWAGPVRKDFDFFKVDMSEIFFQTGASKEEWGKLSATALIIRHLKLSHCDGTH